MARHGPQNGRWKGGISKTYYRKEAGCKRNDGKVVHHLNRYQRSRREIKVLPNRARVNVLNNRGISSRAKHNREHPEKGGFHKSRVWHFKRGKR